MLDDVHSSSDNDVGMRRGVPFGAIKAFLEIRG